MWIHAFRSFTQEIFRLHIIRCPCHSVITVTMIAINEITITALLVMSQFYLHIIDNLKIHSFPFSLKFTFNWNPFYIFKCWLCSFLATYYLKSNESLYVFIECTIEKIGSPCRNSIGTLIEIVFQWVRVGCGWCSHGSWCQWSTTIQHTWPLVTMQACFHDRIKK